jgi:two-component system response regulator RegA
MHAHALIVEDSPAMAERIGELLDAAGLHVIAKDATEDGAIGSCDRHRVDVAVIDLQLAQGTGFGVIRHLRKARPANATCIVVFTNHAVPALKVAALKPAPITSWTRQRTSRRWAASPPAQARELEATRDEAQPCTHGNPPGWCDLCVADAARGIAA